MTDVLTPDQRRKNMSRIRGVNTKPEKILRSLLFREGFRFRLYNKELPGCPDIVLKRYRTVIFVHGCFWHRHSGCHYATEPASNKSFWQKKFAGNVVRDARNTALLLEMNWNVIIIWECQVKIFQKDGLTSLKDVLKRCAEGMPAQAYEMTTVAPGNMIFYPCKLSVRVDQEERISSAYV